jgi:hypothetical protein
LVTAAPLPARSRRVRVRDAFALARTSVRAATPSRRHAPQHARTVTLEARPGLWPISRAGPPARPPRRLRRHSLAVAGCLAHADAEEGAPSSWPARARFTTIRRSHARTSPAAAVGSAATHGAGLSATASSESTPCQAKPVPITPPRTRTPASPSRARHTPLWPERGTRASTTAASSPPRPHRRRPRRERRRPFVRDPSSKQP